MDRYWEGKHGAVFDGDTEPPREPIKVLAEWTTWSVDDMIRFYITDRKPQE